MDGLTMLRQTDVLVGLDSKQPKVVAGCVGCMKDIVECALVSDLNMTADDD